MPNSDTHIDPADAEAAHAAASRQIERLATALPVHLAELQRAAREPPPVRGHRRNRARAGPCSTL